MTLPFLACSTLYSALGTSLKFFLNKNKIIFQIKSKLLILEHFDLLLLNSFAPLYSHSQNIKAATIICSIKCLPWTFGVGFFSCDIYWTKENVLFPIKTTQLSGSFPYFGLILTLFNAKVFSTRLHWKILERKFFFFDLIFFLFDFVLNCQQSRIGWLRGLKPGV